MIVTASGIGTTATIYTASSLGGADDWANVTGLIASGVRNVALADGQTFIARTPLSLVTGLTISGSRGGGILTPMGNGGSGGFAMSIFYAPQGGTGSGNTLTANVAQWSNTVSATSTVAVGSYVIVTNTVLGNIQWPARVLAVSGSGPYTLTLDRCCPFTVLTTSNNAYLYTHVPIRGVRVLGNGMRVACSGGGAGAGCDRIVELVAARNCYFSDIIVDHSAGDGVNGPMNIHFSGDNGCDGVVFERLVANGGASVLSGTKGVGGFAGESTFGVTMNDCVAVDFTSGSTAFGFAGFDAAGLTLRNCMAINCTTSFQAASNETNGVDGCQGMMCYGIASYNNGVAGTVGFAALKSSTVMLDGYTSNGDAKMLSTTSGTPRVEITNFRMICAATGAQNGWTGAFGNIDLTNGTFDFAPRVSGNKAVCDLSAGTGIVRMRNVNVNANATGTFFTYVESGGTGATIEMAGVDAGSTGTLFNGTNGTINVAQSGMVPVSTTGGTTSLTWAQSCAAQIEVSGSLASDATVTPKAIRGAVYLVTDSTTRNGHTLTFAGVTITAGKTTIARLNNSGTGAAGPTT